MMPDHADFSCLQFPRDWEQPKFRLGDRVSVDGQTGLIVGAFYASSCSCNPTFDNYEFGWWFEVAIKTTVPGRVLTNVMGHHQDVLQPVLTPVDSEIQHQQVGMTLANSPEPLAVGVL